MPQIQVAPPHNLTESEKDQLEDKLEEAWQTVLL